MFFLHFRMATHAVCSAKPSGRLINKQFPRNMDHFHKIVLARPTRITENEFVQFIDNIHGIGLHHSEFDLCMKYYRGE